MCGRSEEASRMREKKKAAATAAAAGAATVVAAVVLVKLCVTRERVSVRLPSQATSFSSSSNSSGGGGSSLTVNCERAGVRVFVREKLK